MSSGRVGKAMGPLHDPVTWYKIIYTGEQVVQWDFQNNATRTSSPGPAFVLEVPLRNLLTSIYNFVPCDWVVQRAHCPDMLFHGQLRPAQEIGVGFRTASYGWHRSQWVNQEWQLFVLITSIAERQNCLPLS